VYLFYPHRQDARYLHLNDTFSPRILLRHDRTAGVHLRWHPVNASLTQKEATVKVNEIMEFSDPAGVHTATAQ